MSDYMFMLENHLKTAQAKVVSDIQAAASSAGVSLFLTGGAVRDMLGGFAIRDLAFTVEGNSLQFAKKVAETTGAELRVSDEVRKTAVLTFPGGGAAEIGMSRTEKFSKPGAKPQIAAATIHEHLRQRDFTINALALSLNRGSRGLLIDPTNGLSDLQQKELRTVSNHALYDHPVRIFRLLRYKVRLGFQLAERTQAQLANVREAKLEQSVSQADLLYELRQLALESSIADILQSWEQEGLLQTISPALTGAKLNTQGFSKLQKAMQSLPFGVELCIDDISLFFAILLEPLSGKERTALLETIGLDKDATNHWQKLDSRATKFEKELAALKLNRPSQVYQALVKIPAEQLLLVLIRSGQRTVQERIRNYLTKFLPMAQEVTDAQIIETGLKVGTPKFDKAKADTIRKKLDARPKKPEPVPEPEPVPLLPPGRPKSNFTSPHRS